jgi:phosphonopyruvate decarboxylase
MLTCEQMHAIFAGNGVQYFTGVPDSTFGPWMSYLADHEDVLTHRIAVNEGSAIAHATGYHLATGKMGVAYMQNAGLGNCVNPLTSLVDPDVYSIPMLLMVGWRGEPGRKDEPQHRKMGKVTLPVLDALEIPYCVLDADTADEKVRDGCEQARLRNGAFAFVVRKGLFEPYETRSGEDHPLKLSREVAVGVVVDRLAPGTVVISTTGGISRELFEHREARGQLHDTDFYTVGSMGQASAIAMEVALQKPSRTVCILDGDGALLMHMGNAATIGHYAPGNLVHVVLDNNCNESTGGQPTVSNVLEMAGLARDCGYAAAHVCTSEEEALAALAVGGRGPRMVVIKVRKGSRADLGRPTQTLLQTKRAFAENLKD